MPQQHYSFGGGVSGTILHPIVLIAMIVAVVLILVLPRKNIIIPVLLAMFLIPLGQQLYIAGVHLFVSRIIILIGLIRAAASKIPPGNGSSRFVGGWIGIDTAFTLYVLIQSVAVIILNPDSQAFVNQLGSVWDMLGGYLLLRFLIADESDIRKAVKCFAILCVVLAVGMVIEQLKFVNIFGLLGGVALTPEIRDGKIRSQAVFQHSLTAGTFAATSLPLFFLLWKNGRSKIWASVGILAATVMVFTTQTSTSIITFGSGLVALLFWPLRKKMQPVRRALFGLLLTLHLVMKAPVWFLIARVDLTGSSSSYHRAELIDQFVRHFSDWWLFGTKNASTWGWDMWDAQNMYVSVGEAGGLAALAFFILVISRSFARIGSARKLEHSKNKQWFLWFLGAALFSHVIAFLGVNYFDQSKMAFYALLAMIAAYTAPSLRTKPKSEPKSIKSLSESLGEYSPSLPDSVNAL